MAVEGRLLDYLGPDASGSSSLDKASIIVERFQGGSDAQDKRQALQAMELLLKTRPTAEAVSVTVPVLRYVLGSGLMLADPALGQIALDSLELLCTSLTSEDKEAEGEGGGDGDDCFPLPLEVQRRVSLVLSNEVMDAILEIMHQQMEVTLAVSGAKILRTLHIRAPKETELALLECPAGVQRIVDGLRDPREVIRNSVVLTLGSLTTNCVELCEAVAFQEGLEQLFNIMRLEGMLSGGGVIRDCLVVCINLLKNSVVAQRLFCEGQCIHILHRLIDLRRLEKGGKSSELSVSVSALQEQIMVSGITLLRLLLSRRRGGQSAENQELKHKQQSVACAADGLLSELLVHVALSRADPYSFTPSSVRSIACEAVGDLMNDNFEIQYFMDQMLVMDLGKDSILLSSRLVQRALECAGKQTDVAVCDCLHSLYAGNELGATQALSHVIAPPPPPVGVDVDLELWEPPPAAGSIVLSALEALEKDSYAPNVVDRTIIACKVLALLLKEGGKNAADITLRLRVGGFPDGEPLLSFITRHAEDAYMKETHTRLMLCVEILKVLCQWLSVSSDAVESLLGSPESLFLYELSAKAEFIICNNEDSNAKRGRHYSAKSTAHCIACLILGLCFLRATSDHEKMGKSSRCSSASTTSGGVSQAIENKVGLRRLTSGIEMLQRRVEADRPTSRDKTTTTWSSRCLWTPGFAELVRLTAEDIRSRVIEYYHTEWKRDEGDERVKMMENELKGLSMTILALERQLDENRNREQVVLTNSPLPAASMHHSPPLSHEEHKYHTPADSHELKNEIVAMLEEEKANLLAENENLKCELLIAQNSNTQTTTPQFPDVVQRESEEVLRERISGLELEPKSKIEAMAIAEATLSSQLTSAENDRAAALEQENEALAGQSKTQIELNNTKNHLIQVTERLEEARKEVDELKKAQDDIKTVQEPPVTGAPNDYDGDSFEFLAIIAQLDVMVEELIRMLESFGDASVIELAMNRVASICIKRFGVFVLYI